MNRNNSWNKDLAQKKIKRNAYAYSECNLTSPIFDNLRNDII